VGGVWACWIWGGVEACFLPFLRCRLGGVSKGACGGLSLALLGLGGVEACFLPSLSSRLGGVSKGACGDRCLALPLRYALSRYSGRARRGLVGLAGG